MKKENVDLEKIREFYDPHPGLAGAIVPIPEPVRIAAVELCNQKISLNKAVGKIRAVTTGEVEIDSEYKNINLKIRQGGLEHNFLVIRYR